MSSFERIPFRPEELRVLADLTVELVKLRQNECKHLCIENLGPEIWGKLLAETYPPPPQIRCDVPIRIQVPGDITPENGTGDQI